MHLDVKDSPPRNPQTTANKELVLDRLASSCHGCLFRTVSAQGAERNAYLTVFPE